MKKENILWITILFFFLLGGLFLLNTTYTLCLNKIIENNNFIVNNLIEQHPELEKEIIESLKKAKKIDNNVLEKYGLNVQDGLEYVENIHVMHNLFQILFLSYLIIFMLLFTFYFWYLRKKQSKDIKKIDKYLFSLLSSEIKVDLKDFQAGELASLQNDLMKVTKRLKNALESTTNDKIELAKNLADISHQLKTPLTSLAIMNEALRNPNIDEETKKKFLENQSSVIDHMETLIITLLKVSQIESGTIKLKKETINLKELLNEVLEELDIMITNKGLKIEMNLPDILIKGDKVWLKEAILNIVKNGIEHSKKGGVILMEGSMTPIYTELKIKDYGDGILKKDLPHLFERFYKSSKEKNSIGIGLNLSKSIFDKMNATVRVESKVKEFTEFTIHFYEPKTK